SSAGSVLVPEIRGIWQHEFLDRSASLTNAFALSPGGTFTIHGAVFPRDSGIGGVGLGYEVSPQTKLFLDYDFKYNSEYQAHFVSLVPKYSFSSPPPQPRPQPPSAAPPAPAARPAPPPPAQAQTFVVYFDFDKSSLTPEAVGIIRQAADAFRQTGAVNIKVDGYTDLAGTARYNIGLSKRR